ncbi:MAG: EAL domain-containing protein [Bryobacterales bacterium]|nr:EAL domain-containing protein [Bryobacterales bacterium]
MGQTELDTIWTSAGDAGALALPTEISYLARQPIFDASLQVLGYELLYRGGLEPRANFADATFATLSVISSAFFLLGRETVGGSKMLFLNVGSEVLDDERVTLLNPRQLVLEILEDVARDDALLQHCGSLRGAGFSLALDDIVCVPQLEPLRNSVDFAKVDFLALDSAQRAEICGAARAWRVPIIAEKVETYEDFQEAKQLGCQFFQGYFFAKPNLLRAQRLKGSRSHHLMILAEVSAAEMDFERLEKLMRQDLSLSWLFFRFLNSAQFSWSTEVRSLRHAFALLGAENMRKWVLLAVVPFLASDKPHELVVESLLRARFCELLAESSKLYSRAADLFLVGLFSVLDAVLDKPLREILQSLELPSDVRAVLLLDESANPWMCDTAYLARYYSSLGSEELERRCERLGIAPNLAANCYLEADLFARRVFQMTH